jgi:Ca2+-binding RTX toxin-like protein
MRRIAMLVTTLLVGVLLASGVALALTKTGGPGEDVLRGTNGADRLYGGAGNDVILGLGGDDPRLLGGFGDDSIIGGPGDDSIWAMGIVREPYAEKGSDVLWGNVGDDQLAGGLGPDRLSGGTGRDALYDGLLFGGPGYRPDRSADILRGGAGRDWIRALTGSKTRDLIYCGGGFDQVEVDKGIDRVAEDCEKVYYQIQG